MASRVFSLITCYFLHFFMFSMSVQLRPGQSGLKGSLHCLLVNAAWGSYYQYIGQVTVISLAPEK